MRTKIYHVIMITHVNLDYIFTYIIHLYYTYIRLHRNYVIHTNVPIIKTTVIKQAHIRI